MTGEEIKNDPQQNEKLPTYQLIDFFQKAPIALHWLSSNKNVIYFKFLFLHLYNYFISGTGDIIWANETELKILGYTAEEYIGHSIKEVASNILHKYDYKYHG
jgi:PAS domain-containing protein